MKNPSDLGINRTGIGTSPIDSKRAIEGAQQGELSAGDGEMMARVRIEYIRQADPIGMMPPPTSIKGAAKAGVQVLKGKKPTVLLDKLGERLAFERMGTRLYEALITKVSTIPASQQGTGVLPVLRRFHDEELAHFELVRRAMEQLGADPTVQTPFADVSAVTMMGMPQVLTDPRTSPAQCLQAILVAELVDNDGWSMLIDLTEGMGQSQLAEEFRRALAEENEHLRQIRSLLETDLRQELGIQQ